MRAHRGELEGLASDSGTEEGISSGGESEDGSPRISDLEGASEAAAEAKQPFGRASDSGGAEPERVSETGCASGAAAAAGDAAGGPADACDRLRSALRSSRHASSIVERQAAVLAAAEAEAERPRSPAADAPPAPSSSPKRESCSGAPLPEGEAASTPAKKRHHGSPELTVKVRESDTDVRTPLNVTPEPPDIRCGSQQDAPLLG